MRRHSLHASGETQCLPDPEAARYGDVRIARRCERLPVAELGTFDVEVDELLPPSR